MMILQLIYSWLHVLVKSEFTPHSFQLHTEGCLSAALELCTVDLSSGGEIRLALVSLATTIHSLLVTPSHTHVSR